MSSGATGVLENEFYPFEFVNGGNLYHFVANNPVNKIDSLGLDVWVIREQCGLWGHEWVVGDNGDGTYWDSSKWPSKGGLDIFSCPEEIKFNKNSGFSPRDDWRYGGALCHVIMRHVVTTPDVDKMIRDEARKRAEKDSGIYNAACNNCRDYAKELADKAHSEMGKKTK